jgi:hypothetical protein
LRIRCMGRSRLGAPHISAGGAPSVNVIGDKDPIARAVNPFIIAN